MVVGSLSIFSKHKLLRYDNETVLFFVKFIWEHFHETFFSKFWSLCRYLLKISTLKTFSQKDLIAFLLPFTFFTHITVYMCLEMKVFVVFHNQLQKLSKTPCNNKWWKSGGTTIANLNQRQKSNMTFWKEYLQNSKDFANFH